ncbi:hypothetical protein KM043_005836 [Ampulex compressa]|nr:hypothetical protein KM043_005836 [Ampulex compressa]
MRFDRLADTWISVGAPAWIYERFLSVERRGSERFPTCSHFLHAKLDNALRIVVQVLVFFFSSGNYGAEGRERSCPL